MALMDRTMMRGLSDTLGGRSRSFGFAKRKKGLLSRESLGVRDEFMSNTGFLKKDVGISSLAKVNDYESMKKRRKNITSLPGLT